MKPIIAGLLLVLAAACTDQTTGPTPEPEWNGGDATPPLVVMTRNMYIGANVDRVIAAVAGLSGEDPQVALPAVLQEFIATDLPVRLEAMAGEIARYRPHVIGLQEVSGLDLNLPSEFGVPSLQAEFLSGLQQALAVRGLSYQVVSNQNFGLSLLGGAIALRDSEVLLVDSRLPILASDGGTFSCGVLCLPVPGLGTIRRGWVRARTRIGGGVVTVVSTHTESGADGPIAQVRLGQIQELLEMLSTTGGPLILLGDLNDTPGSAVHQLLAGRGLVDVWASLRPGEPGFTCCHESHLQSGSSDQRIDYIMVQNGFLTGTGRVVPGAEIRLFGESSAEQVNGSSGRIWPSDHAGLVATLPPAR